MPVDINSGYIYTEEPKLFMMMELAKKGCLGNLKFLLGLHRVSFSVLPYISTLIGFYGLLSLMGLPRVL